jgi:hypothetical protein
LCFSTGPRCRYAAAELGGWALVAGAMALVTLGANAHGTHEHSDVLWLASGAERARKGLLTIGFLTSKVRGWAERLVYCSGHKSKTPCAREAVPSNPTQSADRVEVREEGATTTSPLCEEGATTIPPRVAHLEERWRTTLRCEDAV